MNTEELNYARDSRNCDAAKAPVLYLEDGGEETLPMHWAVCDVCKGAGKHINPSIDCCGISPQTFAEDPDFAEDYFGGTYDQTCNCCQGRTTIQVIDWDALTAEQRKLYEQQLKDEADDRACYLAEVRAGA